MYERTTSADRVLACGLWALTVSTYLLAAVFLAHGWVHRALFIAEIACGLSAISATMQIRGYAVRTCEVIRNVCRAHEPAPPSPVPMQRVR